MSSSNPNTLEEAHARAAKTEAALARAHAEVKVLEKSLSDLATGGTLPRARWPLVAIVIGGLLLGVLCAPVLVPLRGKPLPPPTRLRSEAVVASQPSRLQVDTSSAFSRPVRGLATTEDGLVGVIGANGTLWLPPNEPEHEDSLATLTKDESAPLKNLSAGILVRGANDAKYTAREWLFASDTDDPKIVSRRIKDGKAVWTDQVQVPASMRAFAETRDGAAIIAVGRHGMIIRREKPLTSWLQETSHVIETLHSVAISKSAMVTVGEKGMVLFRELKGPHEWQRFSQTQTNFRVVVAKPGDSDAFYLAGERGAFIQIENPLVATENRRGYREYRTPTNEDIVAMLIYRGDMVLVTRHGLVMTLDSSTSGFTTMRIPALVGEIVAATNGLSGVFIVSSAGEMFVLTNPKAH